MVLVLLGSEELLCRSQRALNCPEFLSLCLHRVPVNDLVHVLLEMRQQLEHFAGNLEQLPNTAFTCAVYNSTLFIVQVVLYIYKGRLGDPSSEVSVCPQ